MSESFCNFSFEIQPVAADVQQDEPSNVATKLHTIRELHFMRLLKEGDQFNWSGKIGMC